MKGNGHIFSVFTRVLPSRGRKKVVPADNGAIQHVSGLSALEMDEEDEGVLELSERGVVKFKAPSLSCPSKLSQFDFVSVIGKGSYAKVVLVKRKKDQKLFALKVMTKKNIILKRETKQVVLERRIMSSLSNERVTKLYAAFQTRKKVFMILEFCRGGELKYHMTKHTRFSADVAIYYLIEICLAMKYIHEKKVVFRDLKPQNMLIDEYGHIKISDFGLARNGITQWLSGASTICGSPEYMAPEVIIGQDYGLSCDWWSVGITFYEMISSTTPYKHKTTRLVFHNIIKGTLLLALSWSENVRLFLCAILTKIAKKRIGCEGGAEEILNHIIFTDAMVEEIASGAIDPPIKPNSVSIGPGDRASSFKSIKEEEENQADQDGPPHGAGAGVAVGVGAESEADFESKEVVPQRRRSQVQEQVSPLGLADNGAGNGGPNGTSALATAAHARDNEFRARTFALNVDQRRLGNRQLQSMHSMVESNANRLRISDRILYREHHPAMEGEEVYSYQNDDQTFTVQSKQFFTEFSYLGGEETFSPVPGERSISIKAGGRVKAGNKGKRASWDPIGILSAVTSVKKPSDKLTGAVRSAEAGRPVAESSFIQVVGPKRRVNSASGGARGGGAAAGGTGGVVALGGGAANKYRRVDSSSMPRIGEVDLDGDGDDDWPGESKDSGWNVVID